MAEHWNGSPRAYLGTTVAGFPNLFMLVGPNTGLGHNSIVYMIESQITYLLDALRDMDTGGVETIEVRPEAEDDVHASRRRGAAGHRLERRRLRQLLPECVGSQLCGLAGLHVEVPGEDASLRRGALHARVPRARRVAVPA